MRLRTVGMMLLSLVIGISAGSVPAVAELPGDEPYPVRLRVGETFAVCKSGQILCPVTAPLCDDPNITVPVDRPDGLGFEGVAPGTTLCSAASATGQRRVFRITVR